MMERTYLDDVLRQLRKYRELAERAIVQVPDEHFFSALDPESNSIALIVKHVAGNLRSRWTDFLTTDGEKPGRERDREFVLEEEDTRERIMARWEEGWSLALSVVEGLREDDLSRVVTIRGEPHRVLEAVNRQLAHNAYHVGQIVLLAKHHAGSGWESLSIPKARPQAEEGRVAADGGGR